MKAPVMLDLSMEKEHIPPAFLERESYFPAAWELYCKELLTGLKEHLPAVRLSMSMAAMYGPDGLVVLTELLRFAKKLGYYVLLDGPGIHSAADAVRCGQMLMGDDCSLRFDGLALSPYIGSDCLRPVATCLKETGKDLFVLLRTPNRSAQDLQDLLTGSRLMHMAAADVVNRFCQETGRSGYAQVAGIAAANAGDSLRSLRAKYKNIFLLADGYDATGANAKLCANAFDRFGHGAVVCAGASVTGAWQESPWVPEEYLEAAAQTLERMRKNILKYIAIL